VTLTRGRVLRGASEAEPIAVPAPARLPYGRRVERPIVDAEKRSAEIVAQAEARAQALIAEARREVADLRLRVESEARAEAAATIAAKAVALARLEAAADERSLDRSVELARVLAERLLGEALTLDPNRITGLARQALAEARGARTVRIVAHPEDAAILRRDAGTLGLDPSAVSVTEDPGRARGQLRLDTDIGVLDAEIGPQLHRLAKRLRETLRR
jgi:flagellar biosynthesis/type III secretory pathway protein FliH